MSVDSSEVIQEVHRERRTVHLATLMDNCHLRNAELEPQFRKYIKHTKVLWYAEVTVWRTISDCCEVFIHGASASQMTAAKVMEVTARLLGCAGQAADAVSAYTQVDMEGAPGPSKIPKSECADFGYLYHDTNGLNLGPVWKTQSFLLKENGMGIHQDSWERQFEKVLFENGWEKFQNWECFFVNRQRIFVVCVRGTISRWLERRETLIARWRYGGNTLFLGEPTSFLVHFNLGCTQLGCQTSEDIVENYRNLFESRISAGATEICKKKLTWKLWRGLTTWKVMRRNAFERYLNWQTMQQLHKATTPCIDNQFMEEDLASTGDLSKVWPQIVLNSPYLARIGRLDILWLGNKLARTVLKWTRAWDKRLARLISYIYCTSGYMQYCHVGNTVHCRLWLFQVSDFAGDLEDSKSTSGGLYASLAVIHFSRSWICDKQTSVSHSSTES